MSEPSQGPNVIFAIKEQTDIDTLATGAGADLIEVLPSPGMNRSAATIDSALIDRSGMKRKSRQGSLSSTGSYDVEVINGALQIVYKAVLGQQLDEDDLSEADLTSCTISGTGTVATFGGGDLLALGFLAGRVIKFTNLSVAGNNSKDVPILAVDNTAKTLTFPSGILADNAIDSAFNVHLYRAFSTPTPRVAKYYTLEQYLSDLATPDSILGKSFKFTGLTINGQPNAPVKATFTLSGVNVTDNAAPGTPNFSTPTNRAVAGAVPIIGLDGALYIDGATPAFSVTGLQLGLSANASATPLLFSRTPAGIGLGMFGVQGQITGLVTDLAAMRASIADDRVSFFAWFKDQQGGFESLFMGDGSYGGVQIPIAELDEVQTLPIYGGRDTRGGGYAETTWVISTSATT